MLARPPWEVGLHIVEGVIHPAHVPLVVEAQSPLLGGAGDHGPGRGLFRHGESAGELLPHHMIKLAQKINGLQVALVSIFVVTLVGGIAVQAVV